MVQILVLQKIFSRKISVEVTLYDVLVLELVYGRSLNCVLCQFWATLIILKVEEERSLGKYEPGIFRQVLCQSVFFPPVLFKTSEFVERI